MGATWTVIERYDGILCGVAYHEGKIVIVGDNEKVFTN
jgi:hypothetical protein